MDDIRKFVIKVDYNIKVDGSVKYIGDIKFKNSLYVKILCFEKVKVKIKNIIILKLKDGYYVIEGKDVFGLNKVKIIENDMFLFVDKEVNYIGEFIFLVVGLKFEEVINILYEIKVEYENDIFVFDMRNLKVVFVEYKYEKGNVEKVFNNLVRIIEEEFYIGY